MRWTLLLLLAACASQPHREIDPRRWDGVKDTDYEGVRIARSESDIERCDFIDEVKARSSARDRAMDRLAENAAEIGGDAVLLLEDRAEHTTRPRAIGPMLTFDQQTDYFVAGEAFYCGKRFGGGGAKVRGCGKDTDCKGERICVEGKCTDRPAP
jgi:hypothetical protein